MNFEKLELSYVVPIFQDKKSSNDIEKLLDIYSGYSPDILKKIHFILVDDCSPFPVIIKNKKINFTLVRIMDDIMWNQGGARNLGVSLAKTPKLILTDLDIIFPETVFKDLLGRKIPDELINFRTAKKGKKIKHHINTFFCSKSTYFKSLGIDEEFCGHYGYEDIYFLELQEYLGTRQKRYRKEMIVAYDHKQHSLIRNTDRNFKLLEEKRRAMKDNDPFKAHSRKFLCFDWKEIESNWL